MKYFLFLLLPTFLFSYMLADEAEPTEETDATEQREIEESDPFADDYDENHTLQFPSDWRHDSDITTTQLRVEWYEVDNLTTVQFLDDWKPTSKSDDIRKKFIAHPKTKLSEMALLRLDVGEKANADTIQEFIYPTEYVPNGLIDPPEELKKPDKEKELKAYLQKIITQNGLAPTAFETRNVGFVTEAALAAVEGRPGKYDLSIMPEKVAKIGEIDCGKDAVVATMPLFATVRSTVVTRVTDGQWHLISIQAANDPETGNSSSSRSLALFVRIDVVE